MSIFKEVWKVWMGPGGRAGAGIVVCPTFCQWFHVVPDLGPVWGSVQHLAALQT